MDNNTSLLTHTAHAASPRERLSQSLKAVVDETKQLLKDTQRVSQEQLSAACSRLEAQLLSTRTELGRLDGKARRQVRRAAQATDHAVHQHPYASMGLTGGMCLLLGLLIARR